MDPYFCACVKENSSRSRFFFQNGGGGGEMNVSMSTKSIQSTVLFILINGAACENNLQLEYQLDSDNGYALFSKKLKPQLPC